MVHVADDFKRGIGRARDLFWRQGFEATTIDQLVSETGLNRYSLYGAFGDKYGVFAAALEDYCTSKIEALEDGIAHGPCTKDLLYSDLAEIIQDDRVRGGGCLVGDVAMRLKNAPEQVTKICKAYENAMGRLLEGIFQSVAVDGVTPSGLAPAAAARIFMTFRMGVHQRTRHDIDADALLGDSANLVAMLLGSGKAPAPDVR